MLALPEVVATPILAFCVAALLMPLLSRLAVHTGFVDHPNARKIHAQPIPLLGGVGVYAGVIVTLLLRGAIDSRVAGMMVASLLVMLLGVADDRLDLHSRYRLILQVLVAGALSFSGVRFHFFPVEALDHVVTVLWIVGVINAMNCLDCADGVAGGTCLVVFATLAVLAGAQHRYFVCQASLAAAGAVVGFLIYNVPPARVFLGDTGSTFLGLMVAVLAILANPTPSGYWQLPPAPFLLLVPIFDIAWVHYRRYQAGIRSVRDLLSSTGKDHLPHRLMARGLSRAACMMVVTFLSLLASVGVYALTRGFWVAAAMAIVALIAFLWHLEENAQVVIREEDRVTLFGPRPRTDRPAVQPSLQHEEGVA
jgi:UDP-GlcNAc:undecaprenyl-phosphate/decaprenyl-phosphate GlcNAc-1-phosphate transferase